MKKEEIREKYESVEHVLDDALEKTKMLQVNGEEENIELNTVISTLEEINKDFMSEIEKLEASSEWEKICVAFFGETNAGKSTIIESLRIVFDEESRRAEIAKQKKEYAHGLAAHCNDYNNLLLKLKEINNALSVRKAPGVIKKAAAAAALILLGIVIGYFIFAFGII